MEEIVDTWNEKEGFVCVPPRNAFEMGKFLDIKMLEME